MNALIHGTGVSDVTERSNLTRHPIHARREANGFQPEPRGLCAAHARAPRPPAEALSCFALPIARPAWNGDGHGSSAQAPLAGGSTFENFRSTHSNRAGANVTLVFPIAGIGGQWHGWRCPGAAAAPTLNCARRRSSYDHPAKGTGMSRTISSRCRRLAAALAVPAFALMTVI